MLLPEGCIYDAWLASAELPYDWLIPLLHEKGNARNIYRELIEERRPMRDMIPETGRKLLTASSGEPVLNMYKDVMERHNIRSMTILDEDYPHCLREISDPPGILFYQGNIACLEREKRAAMVGSRSASYSGLKAAKKIASELSRNGVVIVSGLAYGIDAESHRGCLEGGSPTIAVMGCGLEQTYPSGHRDLRQEILNRGGLILSEYAPGSKPVGRHFPYRNRIISGLCGIVILMEAKIRSGSMTTVAHALKQGREVYAYPGDPASPLSEGNHMLLREGARYFTSAMDILQDMNWLDNLSHVRQNSGCPAQADFSALNDSERAVYTSLSRGELGFDELMLSTGLSSSELLSTLTMMQIKRMIGLLPGKKYELRQF